MLFKSLESKKYYKYIRIIYYKWKLKWYQKISHTSSNIFSGCSKYLRKIESDN